jgi:ribonuclease BN (tRNA processing enzyme)/tetratricopeptide (TPR) repeat protein
MAEQQIRQAYNELFSVDDENKKRSALEQLRTEADQLGLKNWLRLIEARLALVNYHYDIAIDLSTSLLDSPELTSEQRAIALLNRGLTYGQLEPPRTKDEIADYTAVIEMPDAPADQKAKALVNRGLTYAYLEPPRTEDAITEYTTVIEMPDLSAETKAQALVNRGNAYCRLEPQRAEDAIADHTAVIEMSDAPTNKKAKALFNRGVTYGDLEPPRTEDAITDYTAVIEMPDALADQKAKALVNRGFTYAHLDPPRTEDAITDYTAVIEMPDVSAETKAKALLNRGVTHKNNGEPEKAKDDLLEARRVSGQIGDKDRIKSIDFMLLRLDVPNRDLSQQDQEIVQAVSSASVTDKQLSVEDKIINEFTSKKTTVYGEYNIRRSSAYIKDTDAENEAILAILKGWGSAVPLILGGEGACRGGGYFIKFNDNGVAVDPGHDFLRNFHDQKFHLRELDAVLVSHNHPDHTHDLKSIDDVKYEMWVSSQATSRPYSLVLDNDTATSIEEWTNERKPFRKPPFRVDANRQDKVDLNKEAGLPFTVESFKVEHAKDVPNAVGYRVTCMKEERPVLTVGFSCDTKYSPELCSDDRLGGCDILVAHMSQPEIPELKDPVNAKFKEGHLGYRGTIELIKNCKPKLTIISEFWAGLADARILLLQGLRNRCKTANILPGGVGLLVKVTCQPMSFQVYCTTCEKWTPHEEIKVGSPSVSFGPLTYLCPDCCL